jgi:hypothetical protein
MNDATSNHTNVTAEWIRRPLPDLGGLSPSEAINDADGRRKLDDLLVELAGHYVRLNNLGLPSVDPAEVRKALGLEPANAPAGTHHHHRPRHGAARTVKPGPVKRNALLDELGTALTGGDVDGVSYFNSTTGAVEHFMHNLGDQENVRIAEADANAEFVKIVPVTTDVRYGIMSDFIGSVEDINIAGRLRTAISGKGAFKRFRETVDEDDALRRRWMAYRTKRHYHLALDWLSSLKVDLARFSLAGSDYDWQPPKAEAEQEPETSSATEASAAPAEGGAEQPAEPAESAEPAQDGASQAEEPAVNAAAAASDGESQSPVSS